MNLSTKDLLPCVLRYAAEQRLAREHVKTTLYFDTGDLRDAIVGLYAYWTPPSVLDVDKLLSPSSMVWALYTSGYLGPVRLSTPHQAELLRQLQVGFQVKYTQAEDTNHRRDFPHVVDEVNQRPGAALLPHELAFKTSEAQRTTWRARLTELLDSGRLDMSPSEVNFEAAIDDDDFKRLHNAFGDLRKNRSLNNFNDAAALFTVLREIRAWKANHELALPQFFATSDYFAAALEHAGLRGEFKIMVGDEKNALELDLLPTPEQLVFRALRDIANEDNPLYAPLAELDRTLSSAPADIQRRLLDLNGALMDSLRAAMQELFLQAQSKRSAAQESESPEVHARLQALADDLKRKTLAFRELRDVWIGSRDALKNADYALWRSRLDQQHNPLFVGGLLRFSFPTKTLRQLEKTIRRVVYGDEEVSSDLARTFMTLGPKTDLAELVCAVAALWLLKLDERILHVLERARPKHFSFRIVEGAALFRMWESARTKSLQDRLGKVIKRLTKDYAQAWGNGNDQSDRAMQTRAQIGIGLAYLEYRAARTSGFKPTWNRDGAHDPEDGPVQRAIAISGSAATEHRLSEAQRAYAANQYLYYLIAAGTDEAMTLQRAFPLLSSVPRTPRVWQPRFDDTIARHFYYVQSASANVAGETETLLRWSYSASELALEGDPTEPEIIEFNNHIKGECLKAGIIPVSKR